MSSLYGAGDAVSKTAWSNNGSGLVRRKHLARFKLIVTVADNRCVMRVEAATCASQTQNNKKSAFVPYYYLPTKKNLQEESLNIGKNAYQLLYFGKYEDSLNLAKLAVKINAKDEKLWLILSEAQLANKLYKKALTSLEKAEDINSNTSEIYFARSKIYLQISLENNKLKMNLEDNGTGIVKRDQLKIFEPKFTTKSAGMGLGLAIVKNIIDSLNGTINFKSKPNKGTKFSITLKK